MDLVRVKILMSVFLLALSINILAQNITGTVDFDVDTLRNMNQINISLSDNSTLTINKTSVDSFTSEKYVWAGKLANEPDSSVMISVDTGIATGNIETENTAFLFQKVCQRYRTFLLFCHIFFSDLGQMSEITRVFLEFFLRTLARDMHYIRQEQ